MGEQSPTATGPRIPGVESLHPIGRGGFATVYQGWQPDFHRWVAVKVLDVVPDDAVVNRFRREVRAMGALSAHPHTVPVYESGTTDGRPYLVMPLLSGSLADELRTGPLPPDDVVRLGSEIADALAAGHGLGLLHRDVKPGNILRNAYGHYQLGDFGIARFSDATNTTREGLMATLAFAAPEVLSGEPATAASDIYSLGATLHAALRGVPPFVPKDGEAPLRFAARVISDPLPGLARTPHGLAAVVERATAKDPEQRFPTAAALRDALLAADIHPVTPAPTAATEPTIRLPPLPAHTEELIRARVPVSGLGAPPHRRAARRWPYVLAIPVLAVAIAASVAALARATGKPSSSHVAAGRPRPGPTTSLTAPRQPPAPRGAPTQPSSAPVAPGATSVTSTVHDYYALVNQHRLAEAFAWLSPAYRQRTGFAAYRGFWGTIARVDVLDVVANGQQAAVTLRYTRTDGTVSTEHAIEDMIVDPRTGHLLIADYHLG